MISQIYGDSTIGYVFSIAGSRTVVGSADGIGTQATFSSPKGLAIGADNCLYVAESGGNLIRKVTTSGINYEFFGGVQVFVTY